MIDSVSFERSTYAAPPQRFEAGTPHIAGAIGLHAAVTWVEQLSLDAIHAHESALVAECRAALLAIPGVTLYGPEDSAGIVSFNVDGVHAHDVATILDDAGVAVRAGHHCAQPLMGLLGVDATCRASFAAHSDSSDIAALQVGLDQGNELDERERKIETRKSSGGGAPARVTPSSATRITRGILAGEKKRSARMTGRSLQASSSKLEVGL